MRKIALCCFREKLRDIADYWQCLETKPLQKVVVGLSIFDAIWSTMLLLPTTIAEFLYVNTGGRSGFVDNQFVNHVDVYQFRRFHDWEVENGALITAIDWTDERLYINDTRIILDEKCSDYENKVAIAGDPGDYLKEVAGHPITSGYDNRFRLMVRLWGAAIFIIYLTNPIIFLAVWWRRRRGRIIAAYVFLQSVPMILLIAMCGIASEHLLCAINVIYGGHPLTLYLIVFTTVFCIYQLLKFLTMELYVIEMHLQSKRKEYGFRRGYRKSVHSNKVMPVGGQGEEVDVEKVVENEKKMFNRVTMEDKQKKRLKTGKALAREILELGGTTEDVGTSEVENIKKDHKNRARKSIMATHSNKKRKSVRASFMSTASSEF